MQQLVHEIDVYCNTLTKGVNFYLGVPIEHQMDPTQILEVISRLPTRDFIKDIRVDSKRLSHDYYEATIDLYVTCQVRQMPHGKRKIEAGEEARIMLFVNEIIAALASVNSVDT